MLVRNASPRGPMCFRCLIFSLSGPCELMLYPCMFCLSLLMDMFGCVCYFVVECYGLVNCCACHPSEHLDDPSMFCLWFLYVRSYLLI